VEDFCQSNSDGVHAHPTDCKHFIECASGRTYIEECGPGTAWNPAGYCDLPTNVPGCS